MKDDGFTILITSNNIFLSGCLLILRQRSRIYGHLAVGYKTQYIICTSLTPIKHFCKAWSRRLWKIINNGTQKKNCRIICSGSSTYAMPWKNLSVADVGKKISGQRSIVICM